MNDLGLRYDPECSPPLLCFRDGSVSKERSSESVKIEQKYLPRDYTLHVEGRTDVDQVRLTNWEYHSDSTYFWT